LLFGGRASTYFALHISTIFMAGLEKPFDSRAACTLWTQGTLNPFSLLFVSTADTP
jgi:hypothetical protein